jgi:hypothetical protein
LTKLKGEKAMAKIEKINMNGAEDWALNISGIVGHPRRGDRNANRRDDVLVIQGFFNYISPDVLGLGGDYAVPQITGIMNNDTFSAIGAFQITNAAQLLMKVFDGRIDRQTTKTADSVLIKSKCPLSICIFWQTKWR